MCFFIFCFNPNSQVISHSTNTPGEKLREEQKWSSLPSVYLYQIKNYRVQNVELLKILFLEKYENLKKYMLKKINKIFYSELKNLESLKLWLYLSKSIDSPQLSYKIFFIYLVQKTKNQKIKIFHEGVVFKQK